MSQVSPHKLTEQYIDSLIAIYELFLYFVRRKKKERKKEKKRKEKKGERMLPFDNFSSPSVSVFVLSLFVRLCLSARQVPEHKADSSGAGGSDLAHAHVLPAALSGRHGPHHGKCGREQTEGTER